MGDPYRRLGLRGNPFVAEAKPGVGAEVYHDRGVPEAPAPSQGRVIQLIGVRGAGKTTLMLKWRAERGGAYRHVPNNLLRFLPLPLGRMCFWDEADRAPRWMLFVQLWIARLIGATIVLGTHEDLGVGQTHRFGPLTGADVQRWAELHIHRASLGRASLTLPAEVAASIAHASNGSWRIAGDLLHMWAAGEASSYHNQ